MNGFAREVWLSRWIVCRGWLIGALKSLAAIAVWALVVWAAVTAMRASGLLPTTVASVAAR
jgi:hypothetical protein